MAFSAQLSAQVSAGVVADSIGKYVLVVLGGNAGVPMGCYFLTLSLMSGIGAPVAVLGIILPIYTIIDMIEAAENVWSDSCVAAMVNHDTE